MLAEHAQESAKDVWLGCGRHPELHAPATPEPLGDAAVFPLDAALRSAPPGSDLVTVVAWDRTRGNERRTGYFVALSPFCRYRWVLWDFSFDDDWGFWAWRPRAATNAPMRDADRAARRLLPLAWDWERRRHGTPRFDGIEAEGLMRNREVERAADRIWRA